MKLTPKMIRDIESDLAKVTTLDDMLGKNGLIKNLVKNLSEQIMEAELEEHLGYKKYHPDGKKSGNSSLLIPKYKKDFGELDKKIISMYAKGMTTRDIADHLEDIYGLDLSPSFISRITERVLEVVTEWQARTLDELYVIVYFDAIHFKVREDHKIKSKAAYTCLAIDKTGHKDLLGIWINESEGANFWLSVISELKNRGVRDILIASVDGLQGFPEAIRSVFPKTDVQLCVIHQIRNSLRYVAHKHKKEFAKDLKSIYKASTKKKAEYELVNLEKKWGSRYSLVVKSWQKKWDDLSTFFAYSEEIRKLIYTTNAVEALHRQFRKVTKTRSVFPNDSALEKMLFLAYQDVSKKWTQSLRDWTKIVAQLAVAFEGRLDLNL